MKSGLIPQKIVDVNGRHTTVYIRPNAAAPGKRNLKTLGAPGSTPKPLKQELSKGGVVTIGTFDGKYTATVKDARLGGYHEAVITDKKGVVVRRYQAKEWQSAYDNASVDMNSLNTTKFELPPIGTTPKVFKYRYAESVTSDGNPMSVHIRTRPMPNGGDVYEVTPALAEGHNFPKATTVVSKREARRLAEQMVVDYAQYLNMKET